MRAGFPFSHHVLFEAGSPTGDLAWYLRDGTGTQVTAGTITPAAGSTSTLITVLATHNELPLGSLRAIRELIWQYPTAQGLQLGSIQYQLDGNLPFPASPDGVRNKIGVPSESILDEEFDLIAAYWDFEDLVTANALASFNNTQGKEAFRIADAIEAMAALSILSTLSIRIAQRESSGTNEYVRGEIDWRKIEDNLRVLVEIGRTTVQPGEAADAEYGSLFIVATGPDRLTG